MLCDKMPKSLTFQMKKWKNRITFFVPTHYLDPVKIKYIEKFRIQLYKICPYLVLSDKIQDS